MTNTLQVYKMVTAVGSCMDSIKVTIVRLGGYSSSLERGSSGSVRSGAETNSGDYERS